MDWGEIGEIGNRAQCWQQSTGLTEHSSRPCIRPVRQAGLTVSVQLSRYPDAWPRQASGTVLAQNLLTLKKFVWERAFSTLLFQTAASPPPPSILSSCLLVCHPLNQP